ncbi:MAG: transposase [Micrococcaceae bacterium]
MNVVRAYPHSIKDVNAGKIALLSNYSERYSQSVQWFLDKYEYEFCTGQKVALQKLKATDVPELYELTGLTHNQYQSVQFQAMETYKSFTAILVKAVRREISAVKSVFTVEGRKELYKANLRQEWLENVTLRNMLFSLVSKSKISFPRIEHNNVLKLTENVCKVKPAKTAKGFEYFAHVSLPVIDGAKRKPIIVPLTNNEHFLEKSKTADKILDGIQLNVENMTATVCTKSTAVKKRETGQDIGLDFGLVNLLTSSNGSRYGQTFQANLIELDKILMACLKGLQQRGIKPTQSHRYNTLVKRIRGYIKTEINRILNRLAETDVKSLTVEKLDFRSSKLSKRLNRIISKSGRAALNNKLNDLTETQGIEVTTVKPEYSSQECSRCGYVDTKNRPTQARFKCLHCGYRLNADVNASRVILNRRSIDELHASSHTAGKKQREKTLEYLSNQISS